MCKVTKEYNRDWSTHFKLDLKSPSGLSWNRDVYYSTSQTKLRYRQGTSAGSVVRNKHGLPSAWKVKIEGKAYLVHRIIIVLLTGELPEYLVVDHLDGNPLNNSPTNIRKVTGTTNSQNYKLPSNNKTGVIGVSFAGSDRDGWHFRAKCRTKEKVISKAFAVKKYGSEEAFRLACEYRTAQIALLNENGANYTDRHGSA